jgi:chromate reductase, NAD(P)H dehydrogenase (quinone)
MATKPRILAFAASARRESLNRKFLAVAVEAARAAGGEVTLVDLNEYEMPLYHGDLEDAQGLPPNSLRMIQLITEHQGLLIASPEYNSMISPLLKNTVDWCTRGDDNPFEDKVAAVISASPGLYGGVLSMRMAQLLLLGLGCHVLSGKCSLPRANEAFDPQGRLTDARLLKTVTVLATQLVRTASPAA